MKNLVIAIVIIAIIALIYTQFNKTDKAPVAAETTTETTTETASLISSAPANADVFILEPGDGATVSSPVTIRFGLANIKIAPAGDNQHHSGHHHLLIDVDELPDMTQPIPANEQFIHYGLGQTEATIELAPGKHSLQLLLGNYLHIPHEPAVISKKITITVE